MTPQLETDLKAWLAKPRDFDTGPAAELFTLARLLLDSFVAGYPAHGAADDTEGDAVLGAMATVAGFENARRMVGAARCGLEAGLTITLEAKA